MNNTIAFLISVAFCHTVSLSPEITLPVLCSLFCCACCFVSAPVWVSCFVFHRKTNQMPEGQPQPTIPHVPNMVSSVTNFGRSHSSPLKTSNLRNHGLLAITFCEPVHRRGGRSAAQLPPTTNHQQTSYLSQHSS